jgi:hypothetical protein
MIYILDETLLPETDYRATRVNLLCKGSSQPPLRTIIMFAAV